MLGGLGRFPILPISHGTAKGAAPGGGYALRLLVEDQRGVALAHEDVLLQVDVALGAPYPEDGPGQLHAITGREK